MNCSLSELRVLRLRSNISNMVSYAVVGKVRMTELVYQRREDRWFTIDSAAIITIRATSTLGSQIRRDYPLNLSILLSGGKETNQDSLSSGERSGMRPR